MPAAAGERGNAGTEGSAPGASAGERCNLVYMFMPVVWRAAAQLTGAQSLGALRVMRPIQQLRAFQQVVQRTPKYIMPPRE